VCARLGAAELSLHLPSVSQPPPGMDRLHAHWCPTNNGDISMNRLRIWMNPLCVWMNGVCGHPSRRLLLVSVPHLASRPGARCLALLCRSASWQLTGVHPVSDVSHPCNGRDELVYCTLYSVSCIGACVCFECMLRMNASSTLF